MRWLLAAMLCAVAAQPTLAEVPRTQRTFELGTYEGVTWPIIIAPIDGPLPASPTWDAAAPEAGTRAGRSVLAVLEAIRSSLRESKYQAATAVRARDGIYNWDCSGMAAWILRRAAPLALRALNSSRPVARDFADAIARAPTKGTRGGWRRIADIADVLPGDVFAWRRPRGFPSKNSGHVGFVLDRPLPVPSIPGAWAVRIADSTSSYHQDDTRSSDVDGGFGIGTLVFLTDSTGQATSYGWAGTLSEWYVVTPVVFGRVSR